MKTFLILSALVSATMAQGVLPGAFYVGCADGAKFCWGTADGSAIDVGGEGCLGTENCLLATAVKKAPAPSHYVFEVIAQWPYDTTNGVWVAVGLSGNRVMGQDTVIACDDVNGAYMWWNVAVSDSIKFPVPVSNFHPGLADVTVIREDENTAIWCTWTRRADITVEIPDQNAPGSEEVNNLENVDDEGINTPLYWWLVSSGNFKADASPDKHAAAMISPDAVSPIDWPAVAP